MTERFNASELLAVIAARQLRTTRRCSLESACRFWPPRSPSAATRPA